MQSLFLFTGVYILQCMTGCEQDEHSGEVKCFLQFSYNVEGLFEFDQKTRTWITLKPDFHISEQMMDGHKNLIKYLENVFSTAFPETLKILLGYGSSSLNKTGRSYVDLKVCFPCDSLFTWPILVRPEVYPQCTYANNQKKKSRQPLNLTSLSLTIHRHTLKTYSTHRSQ